jgi:quinolinate synthase
MNEITLEDTLRALEKNELQIDVDPTIAAKARGSLERMLAI